MPDMFWFLVENDGSFLLAHRKADEPPFADRWVLPGARPDRGESARDVADRIGRDELGFEVMGVSLFDSLTLADGDKKVSVDVHRIGFEGSPRYRESGPYEEVGWAAPSELDDLDIELPPELQALLKRIGGVG